MAAKVSLRASFLAYRASLGVALVMALVMALVCAACGSSWSVVQLATSNPLQSQTSLGVEPVQFEGVKIGEKDEVTFLASKTGEQKETFSEDKKAFSQSFADQLSEDLPEVKFSASPGAAPFLVRPHVTFIEPGFYGGVAAQPTEVEMTLEVLSMDGELFDVVKMRATVAATTANPTSGGRLRSAAEILGGQVADFLRSRVFPK
jgi:hypothetical protein